MAFQRNGFLACFAISVSMSVVNCGVVVIDASENTVEGSGGFEDIVTQTEGQECLKTRRGLEYRGTRNITRYGYTCQAWSSQTPHKHYAFPLHETLTEAQNYCRNDQWPEEPWCYTTDPDRRWDYCDIPLCEADCEGTHKECKETVQGKEYRGTVSKTASGRTCQSWTSPTPHQHSVYPMDEPLAEANNYCRNPNGQPGPWCYSTDPGRRWELCDVPLCDQAPAEVKEKECLDNVIGFEYRGTRSTTRSGRTCQAWSSQTPHKHYVYPVLEKLSEVNNYCRNLDFSAEPWCYTTDPNRRWEGCDIPLCAAEVTPQDCKETVMGTEYRGRMSNTVSGKTCQIWMQQTPHEHDVYPMNEPLEDAANYCRNPDGKEGPWCYTTDPETQWELCDVPLCNQTHNMP